MTHEVFISYSSKDKPIADGICANLESAGVRCWIAPRDIAPGEDWPTAITDAIENSRILVLVFTANSNASEDVSRELYLAANSKLVIIPFKIENVEPEAGKRYYLARTHWLDAMNPPTKEQIAILVQRVKSILPAITPEVQTTSVEPPGREMVPEGKILPKEDEPISERRGARQAKDKPTALNLEAKREKKIPEPGTGKRDKKTSTALPKKKARLSWVIGAGGLVLVAFIVALILLIGNGGILKPAPNSTSTRTLTYTSTSTDTRIPTITITPTPEIGIGSTWVRPVDGMTMVYVPEGEFEMGSNTSADQLPVHTVYLDAYWMDQTEVTNGMFAAFLREMGNQIEGGRTWLYTGVRDELIVQSEGTWQALSDWVDHPVINVSWYGAQAYCNWVGGRLPTEAEWEKTARGTDGRIYPWGNTNPDCSLVRFWGPGCQGGEVAVGSYPSGASPYGALDLAGNVWEWVADWYGETYYSKSPDSNPIGPAIGQYRVLRGGSWHNDIYNIRSAFRSWNDPSGTGNNIGFRCARSLP
jgi:formylglycine-generating enzyme required for sulfatase activity